MNCNLKCTSERRLSCCVTYKSTRDSHLTRPNKQLVAAGSAADFVSCSSWDQKREQVQPVQSYSASGFSRVSWLPNGMNCYELPIGRMGIWFTGQKATPLLIPIQSQVICAESNLPFLLHLCTSRGGWCFMESVDKILSINWFPRGIYWGLGLGEVWCQDSYFIMQNEQTATIIRHATNGQADR